MKMRLNGNYNNTFSNLRVGDIFSIPEEIEYGRYMVIKEVGDLEYTTNRWNVVDLSSGGLNKFSPEAKIILCHGEYKEG